MKPLPYPTRSAFNIPFACSLFFITCMAAIPRCAQQDESLWVDELHTAWVVSGEWSDIGPRAKLGNQQPLYFQCVWLAVQVVGFHERGLRLLSLAAGLGLIPAAAILLRKLGATNAAALWAAMLTAGDVNFVFYAQEARVYAIVQLAAVLHVWLFWKIQTSEQQRWVWSFALVGGVLFHLHYTTVLLFAAEGLYFVVFHYFFGWGGSAWRRENRRSTPWPQEGVAKRMLQAFLLTTLACLPAAAHCREVFARRDAWRFFVGAPSWFALLSVQRLTVYLSFPVLLSAAHCLWRRLRHSENTHRENTHEESNSHAVLILLVCWLVAPLAIAWTLTRADIARLFLYRYLIASAIVPCLLAAWCLARLPRRWAALALASTLAVSIIFGGMPTHWRHTGRFTIDRQEPWREAVARLNAQLQPNDLVLVRSGLIEADGLQNKPTAALVEYCLLPVTGLYRLNIPSQQLAPLPTSRRQALPAWILQKTQQHARIWILDRGGAQSANHWRQTLVEHLRAQGRTASLLTTRPFGALAVTGVVAD